MASKRKKTKEIPIVNGLCASEDIIPLYQFACNLEVISSKFIWKKHYKDFYAAIPENCFCVCDTISKLKIPNQSAIPDDIEFRLVKYKSKNKPISLMHRIRNAFAHGNLSREILNGKDVYKIIDISTRKSKQVSQNGGMKIQERSAKDLIIEIHSPLFFEEGLPSGGGASLRHQERKQ